MLVIAFAACVALSHADYLSCVCPVVQYAAEVLRASHVVVKGDSQLVIRQMTGEYR